MVRSPATRHARVVIRNVVLHLVGEQPLLADMESFPAPSDAAVVCTNVRYMNGRAPLFIDHKESWFLFPMSQLRFVEIPEAARTTHGSPADAPVGEDETPEPPMELELDEDFLRRIREA